MDFCFSEEQKILQKTAREFNSRELEPLAWQIDREGRLPDSLIAKLAEMGWLGMTLPAETGGSGASSLDCALVIEQLAYSGTGAWWLLAFNNSIPQCMAETGTPELKGKISDFCNGHAYASVQFTEEDTGSDPELLKTQATICGDSYIVNGSKRFSTFAARPGLAIVYARDAAGGCSAIVVDKKSNGYLAQEQAELMGGGGIEAADVILNDVKVPASMLLGKPGQGFEILLQWIAVEKIYQCSAGIGFAQVAMDEAINFAKNRMSRGKPIIRMQGIKWMLAEMYCKLQPARLITYRAASLHDSRINGWQQEAAAAKLFVIPAVLQIIDLARQIHGSYGYTRDMKIERVYRAAAGATAIATSLEINRSVAGDWVTGSYGSR